MKKSLSKLPAPKNDYEIVIPDEEEDAKNKSERMDQDDTSEHTMIPDRADIEAEHLELLQQKCKFINSNFFNK